MLSSQCDSSIVHMTLARAHNQDKVPLMKGIITNTTIGMTSFSAGTNCTIGTHGPSELPCTQLALVEIKYTLSILQVYFICASQKKSTFEVYLVCTSRKKV